MERNTKVKRSSTTDLTSGNVWKVLLLYCLPIFGSAMVQQLYSLVDLLVVGNFAANSNLAVNAVGNATTVVNILLAFALGANAGCSVTVAKYFGAKNHLKVRETVNTSVVTFSVLCAVTMVLGFSFGDLSMTALSVDQSYRADCLAYLYIYAGSMPFVFLYNTGCGICSAMGDSKTPFVFLVVSSLLNVVLDLLFVCVFHWDVAGAAWATFISQAISAVLTAVVLIRRLRRLPADDNPRMFVREISRDLIITSVPVILQNAFVSVGNFFVSKRINDISLDATTGFTAAFKLVCVFHWDVAGAAWATFISQAISAVLTAVVLIRRLRRLPADDNPRMFVREISCDLIITSVPVILQNAFVSVGNFFVSKRINDISLDATTGFTAAFKLVCMANMGVSQMTSGLANFCSQNKALGEYRRIAKGHIAVLCYCLITNALFMAAFIGAPEFFTRLFVEAEKLTPDAMAYSVNFLVIVSSFLPVVCVKIVCDGAVRGCGGNLGFTISTFTDLILRVIFVYVLTGPMGFPGVSWAWAIGWSISMFIAAGFYLAVPCLRGVFFPKSAAGRRANNAAAQNDGQNT